KRIITKFTYRIEPKPEGGFIAHASDPSLQPLEAPTRLELQQKIQANISAALAAEFPGLKLPTENQELKFNFHIEAKPGGSFTTQAGSHKLLFGDAQDLQPAGSIQPQDANSGGLVAPNDSSPITPETSSSWTIFRFLLTLLVIAALMYFFLHR